MKNYYQQKKGGWRLEPVIYAKTVKQIDDRKGLAGFLKTGGKIDIEFHVSIQNLAIQAVRDNLPRIGANDGKENEKEDKQTFHDINQNRRRLYC